MEGIDAVVYISGQYSVIRQGCTLFFYLYQLGKEHSVRDSKRGVQALIIRIPEVYHPFSVEPGSLTEVYFLQPVPGQFYLSEAAEFKQIPVSFINHKAHNCPVLIEFEISDSFRVAIGLHQPGSSQGVGKAFKGFGFIGHQGVIHVETDNLDFLEVQ